MRIRLAGVAKFHLRNLFKVSQRHDQRGAAIRLRLERGNTVVLEGKTGVGKSFLLSRTLPRNIIDRKKLVAMNDFSTQSPFVIEQTLTGPVALDVAQVFDRHSVSVAAGDRKTRGAVFNAQTIEMAVTHAESIHANRTLLVYFGEPETFEPQKEWLRKW